MSLIGPILPFLGPLGQILATNSNDILSIILAFVGLVALGLYSAKKSLLETSKSWVGATIALECDVSSNKVKGPRREESNFHPRNKDSPTSPTACLAKE